MYNITKKILAIWLVICLTFAPAISYASSPSGWSLSKYDIATGVATVVRDGYKAVRAIPPSTIAKNVVKVGGAVAVAYAISQLIGAGVDYVMDADNNTFKYKVPPPPFGSCSASSNGVMYTASSVDGLSAQIAKAIAASYGATSGIRETSRVQTDSGYYLRFGGLGFASDSFTAIANCQKPDKNTNPDPVYKTIPVTTVADKIVENAKNGNADAISYINNAITQNINNGTYDDDFNANRVLDDPSANNTADDNAKNPKIDTSSLTAAIASLGSVLTQSINNMNNNLSNLFDAMRSKMAELGASIQQQTDALTKKFDDLAKKSDENTALTNKTINDATTNSTTSINKTINDITTTTNKTINDATTSTNNTITNTAENINKNITENTTKQTTDITTKITELNNKIDSQTNTINNVINSSTDKIVNKNDELKGTVIGLGDKVDTIGGKVVDGINNNNDKIGSIGDKLGNKVDTVGDKIDAVGGKVVGVGDKVVDAINDKPIGGVGVKPLPTASTPATTVPKPTASVPTPTPTASVPKPPTTTKPFELPAFCSWASKLCDAVDWVKSDPDPETENKPDVDTPQPNKSATDFDTDYLKYGGQCPAPAGKTMVIGAQSIDLSIDMTPLCDFVVMVRPAILAMAYLAGLFVVARAIGDTQ